jgi:hypothetical protein
MQAASPARKRLLELAKLTQRRIRLFSINADAPFADFDNRRWQGWIPPAGALTSRPSPSFARPPKFDHSPAISF